MTTAERSGESLGSAIQLALQALRDGRPVFVLDDADR